MSYLWSDLSTKDEMKLSVCISTHPASFDAVPLKGDFTSNVSLAKQIGFDGVELAIRDPRLINKDSMLRLVFDAGLEIPAIATGQAWGEEGLSFTDPDPAIRQAAINRVKLHIDFSKDIKALIIIGLLRGKIKPGIDFSRAYEWMFSAFSDCCAYAEKNDVRIAFEPINRYETSLLNTIEDSLIFIEKIGSKNLGLLIDSFHMNIEEPSIEKSISLAKDRIFHFHYADSNRRYPGAGHLNFSSILDVLDSIGYSGYLSGEHRSDLNPEHAVRQGFLTISGILKESKERKKITTN